MIWHWDDEDEVRAYLKKILHKEAFDHRGLIYGMGHAVYSISDPRAVAFRGFVERLATEKHENKDYALYSMIERIAPEVIGEECAIYKGVSANVDFYSGFVYSMLGIPAVYSNLCDGAYRRLECAPYGGADQCG